MALHVSVQGLPHISAGGSIMTENQAAIPTDEDFYTDAQRKLQDENGHTKLSHAVIQAIVRDELEEYRIEYIETRDYFFLSTVTAEGEPTMSYKGSPVGFVKPLGDNKLVFPKLRWQRNVAVDGQYRRSQQDRHVVHGFRNPVAHSRSERRQDLKRP